MRSIDTPSSAASCAITHVGCLPSTYGQVPGIRARSIAVCRRVTWVAVS
jgi:hypothetical protein